MDHQFLEDFQYKKIYSIKEMPIKLMYWDKSLIIGNKYCVGYDEINISLSQIAKCGQISKCGLL